MGNEDFVSFVMEIAQDRFTREQVEAFVRGESASAILQNWKTLYDNGEQQAIRENQNTWEGNPQGWQTWGDLEESETEYNRDLDLLQQDLEAYQDELKVLEGSNNTPLARQAIQNNIDSTVKGIADLNGKLKAIEDWKASHPNTSSTS